MPNNFFLVFMLLFGFGGILAIIFALRAKHLWNGKPIGILRSSGIILTGTLLIMLSLVTIPPEFGWRLPAIALNLFGFAYPIVGGCALLLILLTLIVERAREVQEGRQA
jgi:hypothetical protein